MKRESVIRVRLSAATWAEQFLSEMGDEDRQPSTPHEAYARASWMAEMRMVSLCDALLAEDPDLTPGPIERVPDENWSA